MKKDIIDIKKVAKEIVTIEFKKSDTLNDCLNKFYVIMRKYNIKQGTKTENGRQCNNFEWTLCKQSFEETLKSFFELDDLFGNIPEDLLC
ncbi:MAG: hypothetical protein PHF86_00175 [Candidatus Nanoarchaeia archaeon]|nr:hypothetical protein [Candidatus Nanoarchaeia archaeon]